MGTALPMIFSTAKHNDGGHWGARAKAKNTAQDVPDDPSSTPKLASICRLSCKYIFWQRDWHNK